METSFLVNRNGWFWEDTGWCTDESLIDQIEASLVKEYPANKGFTVWRLTRVDITQPGEDNGPVEA